MLFIIVEYFCFERGEGQHHFYIEPSKGHGKTFQGKRESVEEKVKREKKKKSARICLYS